MNRMNDDKPKKLSRRQFLKMSGVGVTGVVLASCAPIVVQQESESSGSDSSASESESSAPVTEPITLELLTWGGGTDAAAFEELGNMYKDINSNVTVSVLSVAGGGDELYAKFRTLIAGGETPHVSLFQGWEWQPFFDRGVMADINDFVAADSYFEAVYDDSIQSIKDSTLRDGKRILIPLQWGTMLMFYSKPVFDAAGVDYPTNDWTMDDFVAIAEQLTSGEGADKVFGAWANGSWFRDIHYIRSTGKQEFDSLVDPKQASFNQPEIVDAIQLVAQDMVHKLGVAPSAADTEGGAVAIESGNVGMKYEGAWYMPRMNTPELREEGKEVPFNVVLMPKAADGSRPHRGWSEGLAIPKSDNIADAWELVSFMAGEEGNKVYATITGRLPNTEKLFREFWLPTVQERFGLEDGENFFEAFKRSEVDVIGGVSRTQFWLEAVKPIGYDPILNNSATAAEVMPKVDEAVQGMLDDFWS